MGLEQGLDAIQAIHQAFQQGYENELQRKKQATDLVAQQDAIKRANDELEIHKKAAMAELDMHKATVNHMNFQDKAALAEYLRTGVIAGNTTNSIGTDTQGNQIPTIPDSPQNIGAQQVKGPVNFNGVTLQGNEYNLPADVVNQQISQQQALMNAIGPMQINQAVQQKVSELSAAEPFDIRKNARDVAGKIAENAPTLANQLQIAQEAQTGENDRAQLNAATTIAGHRIQAAASNYNAQANNFMLPEQQVALADQAISAAGGAPLTGTAKSKEAVALMLSRSGQVLPAPKDIDTIKALPQAFDTLKMIQDFTKTFGTNSEVKAYLSGRVQDDTNLPTDARAALNAINTRAIGFSKVFEGTQGIKFTNQDLKLVMNGMVQAGATNNQNKLLSNNLNALIKSAANKAVVQYSPEQRELIFSKQGFFDKIPESSDIGGKLNKTKTVNQFLKTGSFTPIYD